MSPLDPSVTNDADQVIGQDDLIAFHLHELSLTQEGIVRRALEHNPELQSESVAIASVLGAFPKHEASFPLDAATLEYHWQTLRPSLTAYVLPTAAPFRLSNLQRWALPTFAAAALAASAIIVALYRTQPSRPIPTATNYPKAPSAPTPVQPSVTAPHNASAARIVTLNAQSAMLDTSSTVADPVPPIPLIRQPATAASPAPKESAPFPNPKTSPLFTDSTAPAAPGAPVVVTADPVVATAAQPISTAQNSLHVPARTRHEHTSEITVAMLGNLSAARSLTSTSGTGASTVTALYGQSTDPSIGVLASFHQQFRPLLGYRITGSYSEPGFQYRYSTPANSASLNSVNQNVTELSGSYVVESKRHHRIYTSAEAGASLLSFVHSNPGLSTAPVGNAFRPAGVVGASVEFAIKKHWAIHTSYRALLYNAPAAYSTYGSLVPTTPNQLTITSEPVVGLTYRFHPANK